MRGNTREKSAQQIKDDLEALRWKPVGAVREAGSKEKSFPYFKSS